MLLFDATMAVLFYYCSDKFAFVTMFLCCIANYQALFGNADDRNTGKANWPRLRTCRLWGALRWYFSFERVCFDRTAKRSLKGRSGSAIFAGFPHGALATSTLVGWCTCRPEEGAPVSNASTVLICVSSTLLNVPILGVALTWLGCIDATAENIESALDNGTDVYLLPEGKQGAMLTRRRYLELYVSDRCPPEAGEHVGFLKLAWDKSVPVIPVFNCGETDVFSVFGWLPGAISHFTVKHMGFSVPFLFGPHRTKLLSCIGSPVCPRDYRSFSEFYGAFYLNLFRLIAKHSSDSWGPNLERRVSLAFKKASLPCRDQTPTNKNHDLQ